MNGKRQKKKKRLKRIIIAYILRISLILIVMGMAVLMFCGCLYIRDFFRKGDVLVGEGNFNEIFKENEEAASDEKQLSGVCVVLDAGHGGKDGGTVGSNVIEKEINLSVVLFLKDILQAYGGEVILTRSTDENLELSEGIEIANQADADLFVSLHCNYYEDDASVSGLECYYYPDNTESRKYAESIISSAKESESISVREAKAESYYVLSETAMPAVLIEMGFLSNHAECQRLANSDYQGLLAEKIAEGILEIIDG